MIGENELYWQIYKKSTADALGHRVGIIQQGFKTPPYSRLIEVFRGTQEEAIERAKAIEKMLNIS